jgi:subfamily B ATP-binding cassette protein MsbA
VSAWGEQDASTQPRLSPASLRRLWGILKPVRWRVLASSLALVGATGLQLAVVPLAERLVNAIQRYAGTGQSQVLLPIGVAIIAVILARASSTFLHSFLLASGLQRVASNLRSQVFARTLEMSHAFFDERRTGDLLSMITGDIPTLQTYLATAVTDVIAAPLMIAGGVACLFLINWRLAVLSLVCLPATAWLILVAGRQLRAYQARVQSIQANLTALTEEKLAGARVVKAFGAEAREAVRFQEHNRQALRAVLRSNLVRSGVPPAIEAIGAASFVLVLGYGGYQIVMGGQAFGGVAALILVLERISNAARQAGNISMNLGQAAAAAERIFRFLDLVPVVRDRPGARPLGRIQGRVEFDRVSFGYSPSRPVLRDLTFRIEPGQVVALVGRSGMGKSTIAALIPRFYDVTSGRVLVDGRDVREATLASLRAQVAVVPQEVHLFAGSIRENIEYGRCGAAFAEVESAARAANAHEFISRLPQGYETQVGERGARLSGGQRQRLAIARALLRDPRILLLDEATASLDSESEALVQEALERLMVGRTTLVIAHRLSTVRSADVILVIEHGQIAERGSHPELLSRGGLYAGVRGLQLSPPAGAA